MRMAVDRTSIRLARWAGRILALSASALALILAAPEATAQQQTRFKPVEIILSKVDSAFNQILPGSTISDPAEIFDETFIYLDLRVVLDLNSPETAVTSVSDLSPTGTPATGFCLPGDYGKLDMASDLAYTVVTTTDSGVEVTGSVYPGDRSENPYNDVFCAFEGDENQAVFRLRGFFFVMRDQTAEGVYVQLRPVNPTADEARIYWTEVAAPGGQ